MKKTFFAISTLCFLAACAAFLSDYVVTENSEGTSSAPFWISPSGARKIDPSDDAGQYLYFVGEAQDKSQRLCLKNAETDALKEIASETRKKVMKRFREIKKSQKAFSAIKEKMEQNLLVFVQNDMCLHNG